MRDDGSEGTLVLGGGPAGLTAGYVLAQHGRPVTVVEAGDQVGGLAKTVVRDGYRFDLGGHRFFTKSDEVERLWHEVLGDELLLRPRLSRIYWNGRFIDYPLRGGDVLRKLGPLELTRASLSYIHARARPRRDELTFEHWVSNRFGRRLFELFFRSYTEKVWGVPTSELRAEWAAQRIRGLSFGTAVRSALQRTAPNDIRSLITEFHYPRLGPGQMWETMSERIEALGGEVRTDCPVSGIELDGGRVEGVRAGDELFAPEDVVSSLPLRTIVRMASPAPSASVRAAAAGLRYRDFITVALVVNGADPFPDNWIYVHEPGVAVGRIQNYRSWSPAMVPDESRSCLGLEYFCFQGDELWRSSDEGLVDRATRELERLRLVPPGAVERGYVVRVPKAYPIYDSDYAARIATIREWLDGIENLHQVGRNGLHRYNNSDHSCLTAMRAVDNVLTGAGHDVWSVNAESAYHEERVVDEHPYRRAPSTVAMQES